MTSHVTRFLLPAHLGSDDWARVHSIKLLWAASSVALSAQLLCRFLADGHDVRLNPWTGEPTARRERFPALQPCRSLLRQFGVASDQRLNRVPDDRPRATDGRRCRRPWFAAVVAAPPALHLVAHAFHSEHWAHFNRRRVRVACQAGAEEGESCGESHVVGMGEVSI